MKKWTNKNVIYIKKMVDEGFDDIEIASKLKTTAVAISKVRSRNKISRVDSNATNIEDILKQTSETNEKAGFKREKKLLIDEVSALRKLLEAQKHPEVLWNPIKLKTNPNKLSESIAIVEASDWHVEERVRPEEINRLNNYTLDIAKERSEYFAYRTIKFLKMYQKDTEIKTLVVLLNGDFITGNIHEELIDACSLPPVKASLYARELLRGFLGYISTHIEKDIEIKVVCCSGNHSRITKQQRHYNEAGNSLEYMMYHYLATDFKDIKNIQFYISEGAHYYLDIYGMNIRCAHGHQIRFGGGVGGLLIPMRKKVMQWDKIIKADLNLFAHFHQEQKGQKIIVNGSMIGFNKFALDCGFEYESPKQAFFLINRKKKAVSIYSPIIF